MEAGLLDDFRYSNCLFDQMTQSKKYRPARIEYQFELKGISHYLPKILEEANICWVSLCATHLTPSIDYCNLTDKEAGKVFRKLMNKGFDYDVVQLAFIKIKK